MTLTRTTTIRIIKGVAFAVVILVVAGYAIARSLTYARGPHILIDEPADGTYISTSTVTIIGTVQRARDLSLNGHPVAVDEQGHFKETIIIFPGINYITLTAQDQFGRATEIRETLVGSQK